MFLSRHLLSICIAAIIVRLIFILTIPNLQTENYWEYGEIGKNIVAGNGYSFFYFENDSLQYKYKPGISPFSSAYMPPGYTVFLLPFLTIQNVSVRNITIFALHILISVFAILLLYYYTKKYFSEKIAITSAYFASFLPDFIYAVTSFTPTIVFHCGLILLLAMLQSKRMTYVFFTLLGFIISFLIYMRSEFIIFFILVVITFMLQKQWKKALVMSSTVVLLIAPWSIRNYNTFHSFVPLTTNLGLNLYRGNNGEEIGAWGNVITKQKEKTLPRNSQFEITYNSMFFQETSNYIIQNPMKVLQNIPVKLFDLWIFNRHSERSNTFYHVYSLLFAVLFFIGLTQSMSKKYLYLYLCFLYFSIVVIIFFCLPRYQTMMRIGMIPFAVIGMNYVIALFYKKAQSIS